MSCVACSLSAQDGAKDGRQQNPPLRATLPARGAGTRSHATIMPADFLAAPKLGRVGAELRPAMIEERHEERLARAAEGEGRALVEDEMIARRGLLDAAEPRRRDHAGLEARIVLDADRDRLPRRYAGHKPCALGIGDVVHEERRLARQRQDEERDQSAARDGRRRRAP